MMLLPVTLESKISYFLWNQKYVVSWLTTRIRQLHNVYDILWRARKSICLSPKVRVFLCSWIYERTTEWSWVCPWLVHHGDCYSGECVFWECNIGKCDTGGCVLGDCNIGECLCKCDIDRCVLRECQHGECGIGERPSCIPCYLYPIQGHIRLLCLALAIILPTTPLPFYALAEAKWPLDIASNSPLLVGTGYRALIIFLEVKRPVV